MKQIMARILEASRALTRKGSTGLYPRTLTYTGTERASIPPMLVSAAVVVLFSATMAPVPSLGATIGSPIVASPVPEPRSLSLVLAGFGLGSLALGIRRRRKVPAA